MGPKGIIKHLPVSIIVRSFDFRRNQKGVHLKVKISEARTRMRTGV